jgi:hypothetical protein
MSKRSRGCCADLGGACHRPLRVRVSPESWRRQVDCQVQLPRQGAAPERSACGPSLEPARTRHCRLPSGLRARVDTNAPRQARNCRADLLRPFGPGRACLPKVESLPCARPSRCRTEPRHRIRAPPRGHPGRTPESGTPAMHRAGRVTSPGRGFLATGRGRERCSLMHASDRVLSAVRVPTIPACRRPVTRACRPACHPSRGDKSAP